MCFNSGRYYRINTVVGIEVKSRDQRIGALSPPGVRCMERMSCSWKDKSLLEFEHTAAVVTDEAAYDGTCVGGSLDSSKRCGNIRGKKQNIIAGHQSSQFGITRWIGIGNSFHIKAVGYDYTIEGKPCFQAAIYDCRAQGCRTQTVNCINLQMSNHYAFNSRIYQSTERE